MKTILILLAMLPGSHCFAQSNIQRIEYFIGTDPGFGLATPVTNFTSSSNVSISSFSPSLFSGLTQGMHRLSFRSMDDNGHWGLTNFQLVYVEDSSTIPKLIDRIEYFWDLDSGIGSNGTFIPLTPFIDSSNFQFSAYVPIGLQVGYHTLCLRSHDTEGNWSLTNRIENIFVDTITHVGINDPIGEELSIFPNPFQDHITIRSSYSQSGRLIIYDQSGRLVLDDFCLTNQQIDVTDLSSGTYSVFIWMDKRAILKTTLIKN